MTQIWQLILWLLWRLVKSGSRFWVWSWRPDTTKGRTRPSAAWPRNLTEYFATVVLCKLWRGTHVNIGHQPPSWKLFLAWTCMFPCEYKAEREIYVSLNELCPAIVSEEALAKVTSGIWNQLQCSMYSEEVHYRMSYCLNNVGMFGEVTGARELEGKLAMDFYWTPRHCERLFLVQVFSSWMHICAIRIFTESILRYGLPPQFLVSINCLLTAVSPNCTCTNAT